MSAFRCLPELLLAFIAACVLLGLTPGPNMALMIANTLAGGLRARLITLTGTATGLALLVAAAAAGMTRSWSSCRPGSTSCAGSVALYLVYLGAASSGGAETGRVAAVSLEPSPPPGIVLSGAGGEPVQPEGGSVPRGISTTVRGRGGRSRRATRCSGVPVLSSCFVVVDALITLAIASARATFGAAHLRLLDAAGGVFLLLGGAALAAMRRP